jgi:hypothetical protein
LLEAIYIGLYGEEAVTHRALDRAGLKAKAMATSSKRRSTSTRSAMARTMEVAIEITRPGKGSLRLTRKWFFSSSGKYETSVWPSKRVVTGCGMEALEGGAAARTAVHLRDSTWLAPFFFFDGRRLRCWPTRIVPAGLPLGWKA